MGTPTEHLLQKILELEEGQAQLEQEMSKFMVSKRENSEHRHHPSHHDHRHRSLSISPQRSRLPDLTYRAGDAFRHRKGKPSALRDSSLPGWRDDDCPPGSGIECGGLVKHHCLNILHSMGQAVHVLDISGRIIYWNRTAENLYGYFAPEVLGKDGIKLLVDISDVSIANHIINQIKVGDCWSGQFPMRKKSGEQFSAIASYTPLYDDDCRLMGITCVSNDTRLFKESIVASNDYSPSESQVIENNQLSNNDATASWSTSSVSSNGSISSSAIQKVDMETDCLDYEILWEDLIIGEQIGQGSCGSVYHALWYGSDVAVKVFSKQEYSEEVIESFRQEVSLMKRMRHPNILLFMGAVTSPERLCIVTEFLPRGSLFRLLQKTNAKLHWRRRVHMAMDIARGMNYLHHCSPPIVHRDLKSSNLLVDRSWTVKVGDFGLSRLKHETYLTTMSGKGTPQWMAPEVLHNEPSDEKSDVYSYGVILWELVTEKIPWDNLNSMQVIGAVGFMDQRLELPSNLEPQWVSIIESCWHSDPQYRPTFQELLGRLKGLQRQYAANPSHATRSVPVRYTNFAVTWDAEVTYANPLTIPNEKH